jgi:hypothetical protein
MIETFIVILLFSCCCTIQIPRCFPVEFLVAERFKLRGNIMFRGWPLGQSAGALKFFLMLTAAPDKKFF